MAPAGEPRLDLGRDLAGVVRAFGEIEVPADALVDAELRWYRCGPLAHHDAVTRKAIEDSRVLDGLDVDLDGALHCWDAAMALPGVADVPPARWLHADMFAENLLVREGRLVALLDFGGLAVGDPTVDLMVAWEVLDPVAREAFRQAVGVDDNTWQRARAWALSIALNTFPYYWRTMPDRCAGRVAIVRAVLADAAADSG